MMTTLCFLEVNVVVDIWKTQWFEGFHSLSQTKLMRATRIEFDHVILTDESQKANKNKQREVDFIIL